MDTKERDIAIEQLKLEISEKENELNNVKGALSKLLLEKEYDEIISKFDNTYWKDKDTMSYIYIKKINMSSIEYAVSIHFSGVSIYYSEESACFNYRCSNSNNNQSPLEIYKSTLMNNLTEITKDEFEKVFDTVKNKINKLYKI